MSAKTDQDQYVELYFDLEKVKAKLVNAYDLVNGATKDLMNVYAQENKMQDEGIKPRPRVPLDIATRSAITASLAMLFPQLQQLTLSLQYAQDSCEMMCPALQTSKTPN